jgi:hypothetical protein
MIIDTSPDIAFGTRASGTRASGTRGTEMDLQLLRVLFTLRHTTSRDLMDIAFPASHTQGEPHVMSRDLLTAWVDRYSGFGEWPVKRPIQMIIEVEGAPTNRGSARTRRFERRFGDGDPIEVTRLQRSGDHLYQDNDVMRWRAMTAEDGSDEDAIGADLLGAVLRVRAAYLSFDDINFRRPPRFQSLQLHFGDAMPCVLFFTEAQLTSPLIGYDPAPLMHGAFFKTLVIEYRLTLTSALLSSQLVPLSSGHGSIVLD